MPVLRPDPPSPQVADGASDSVLDADLRALLETLPQMVWRCTPDGLNDYFNAVWLDYTGVPAEASRGTGWSVPVHPDDVGAAVRAWEASVHDGTPYDIEFRLRARDGTYRWFLSRGRPLRDASGRIVRWYGTSTDIDAQKRIEVQFRAIADAIPQMVWTALPDGQLDYANERIYQYAFAGNKRVDLRGRAWEQLVHRDELGNVLVRWRRALQSGEPFEADARLLRADGAYRWHMLRASAVRESTTNRIARWFGTCTDIDEMRGAAARDAFLAQADALFAVELNADAIMAAVARAAVASFADYVLFDLLGAGGQLRRAAVEHRDPRRREPFARSVGEAAPAEHPVHPIPAAWLSGESVLVPRIDEAWWQRAAKDDAHFARMRDEHLSSLISVVITSRGRKRGVLTFCRTHNQQSFSDADLATAEDLARRIGAALENARLYQEARAAAETQRRIAEREAFYARLGESLAETLDLHETLDAATRLLVPPFADWAVVNLIDRDGALFLAASQHRDPALAGRTTALLDLRYLAGDATGGAPHVLRDKRPLLYERIPDGGIGAVTGPYREAIRALGVESAVIVPIALGGAVRGTLALMYDRSSGRSYSPDDLPLVIEVARRLAPAIANAEAYERERRVARTFQAAALTTELPRIEGMTFDALYEAGRSESLLGGDWYDAFRVADGRVVVSVGDVAGSGLDAAATMAAIRQSLRGAAAINPEPSVMLDAADRVLRSQVPDTFVTAWVGVLDPVWATLACAGAGHPPPLRRDAAGAVTSLPGGGLPLGLRERGADVTHTVALTSDTTLLLYTDGVVEATRDIVAGESALLRALCDADVETAPARAILQSVLGGTEANDDVALLVVAFRRVLAEIGGTHGAQVWRFDTSEANSASRARAEIVALLGARGLSDDDRMVAELIYAELVGNAKRYAPGTVSIALDLSAESAVLHVVDGGPGFQHNARLPVDALAESGRGLYIVATLAEEFSVTRHPAGGAHARAVLKGRLGDPVPPTRWVAEFPVRS